MTDIPEALRQQSAERSILPEHSMMQVAARHIETLEASILTIQSSMVKYLKKEMTAEEFALEVIGAVDNGAVNKALEGKK